MIQRIAIVIPVFNDWPSLGRLIEDIHREPVLQTLASISIVAVNDGSTNPFEPASLHSWESDPRFHTTVLHLKRNVGHQNAIATGLGWVEQAGIEFDAVAVMDGDGEDRPQDLPVLIQALEKDPDKIIMAKRGKRRESLMFRLGYSAYKLFFWLLTGQRIAFGNFSLLPVSRLAQLTNSREIWHSYAGGILRSRIPRHMVRIDRGVRYFGQSKMNLTSLILHGLSAIAVFVDVCTVRVLILSLGLMGICTLGIVTVVTMKFLGMTSPGWASTMALLMTIVSLQVVLLSTVLTFILFIYRNLNTESPVGAFTRLVKDVAGAGSSAARGLDEAGAQLPS